ncbi:MAG: hypothetical protein VX100_07860 [Pseudomonadota bacterium]|nr:hypothetical protein [Pseudomonadota bacterium]
MKYLAILLCLLPSMLLAKPSKGRMELDLTIEQAIECYAPRPCFNSFQSVIAPIFELQQGYQHVDGLGWTYNIVLKEWDKSSYELMLELIQQEKHQPHKSESITIKIVGKFNQRFDISYNYPELKINGTLFFAIKRS